MSLIVSTAVISATTVPALKSYRDHASSIKGDREVLIDTKYLDVDVVDDLIAAATGEGDKKAIRALQSIQLAISGRFDKPVPNFKAFKGVLERFLKADAIDGWIYVTESDDKVYPALVTAVSYDDGVRYGRDKPTPTVRIHTASYGFNRDGDFNSKFGLFQRTHSFTAGDVVNRRVADILSAEGIFKESPSLRDAHIASVARHHEITQDAFSKQFRVSGKVYQFEDSHYRRRDESLVRRRVIHDLEAKDYGPICREAESYIFEDNAEAGGLGVVPEHPVVKVFDLRTHDFYWVHSDNMTPYVYNKGLREKLILPESHRDLLDVLTSDIGAFVEDFIEGKSAGNVILCKGIPGVGKTLTAEVYAELIERPLYSIHSGSLGTTAKSIEKSLQEIFQRGKRWNCVLLLDEADVFVVQRGANIEQNAIVAEFLRTLEYFDGLLFMTTNRPDDIDEAIVSRCAAIIDYLPPTEKDAKAIWRVMASQFETTLSDSMIADLVQLFPEIAPRDIKMLFRLALRVSVSANTEVTIDTFRRCAMFRAVKMAGKAL